MDSPLFDVWKSMERLAPARFSSYQMEGDGSLDPLARYLWNIKLSQSIYPVTSMLEVVLRNAVHSAMTAKFGNPLWLFEQRLERPELELLRRTLEDVKRKSPLESQLSPDTLIANTPFRLWTGLLHSRYESDIWRPLLRYQFMPNRPKDLHRTTVQAICNRVREIRNRAYHSEPIWNHPMLIRTHDEAVECVRWFSSQQYSVLLLIDDFPKIYGEGLNSLKKDLSAAHNLPQGGFKGDQNEEV